VKITARGLMARDRPPGAALRAAQRSPDPQIRVPVPYCGTRICGSGDLL